MIEEHVQACDDPIVHYRFALDCQAAGDFQKAIRYFKRAILLDPDRVDAEIYAFAAWLLAMCPDASLRDGSQAVEYATTACNLTGWIEGWTIGILAAATAEAGDINNAVVLQEQACKHAFDGDAKMLQENLALLKSGRSISFNCYP